LRLEADRSAIRADGKDLAFVSISVVDERDAKCLGRYDDGWEALKNRRHARQKTLGFNLGENSPFEYMVTAPWSWPDQWLADSIDGEMRLALFT